MGQDEELKALCVSQETWPDALVWSWGLWHHVGFLGTHQLLCLPKPPTGSGFFLSAYSSHLCSRWGLDGLPTTIFQSVAELPFWRDESSILQSSVIIVHYLYYDFLSICIPVVSFKLVMVFS